MQILWLSIICLTCSCIWPCTCAADETAEVKARIARREAAATSAAAELMGFQKGNVSAKTLKAGMQQQSFKVHTPNGTYFLHLFEEDDDGVMELARVKRVGDSGLGPAVLFGNTKAFMTHFMNATMMDGWYEFNSQTKCQICENSHAIGKFLATFHSLPSFFGETEISGSMRHDVAQRFSKAFESGRLNYITKAEVDSLMPLLEFSRTPAPGLAGSTVFAHNDLHARNLMLQPGKYCEGFDSPSAGDMCLLAVDNTEAGPNTAGYDLAYFFSAWTYFGGKEGSRVGWEDDFGSKSGLILSSEFWGNQSYPSLRVRRGIAAEYIRTRVRNASRPRYDPSKDEYDEFVWGVEHERVRMEYNFRLDFEWWMLCCKSNECVNKDQMPRSFQNKTKTCGDYHKALQRYGKEISEDSKKMMYYGAIIQTSRNDNALKKAIMEDGIAQVVSLVFASQKALDAQKLMVNSMNTSAKQAQTKEDL